jgi:AraC-like DNA-binding protein
MVRIVILLAPVFMSLFWAVTLMIDNKGHHVSRRYLSVFMLLSALLMFCHFLYFAPFPEWFVYFDLPLQFFGLLVFPLYHIYFRLLTVDDTISYKKLIQINVVPLLFLVVYAIAIFNSTWPEYKAWLFNKTMGASVPSVQFLQFLRTVIKITFFVQAIYYIAANHILINKYADRAMQFYSDVRDARTRYAKMLNLSILAPGVVTLVLVFIGRTFLMSADVMIFLGWSSLTVAFYLIGRLGAWQKVINPDLAQSNDLKHTQKLISNHKIQEFDQDAILNKILVEFTEKKMYLKCDLTIQDLAKTIGSNRTYISIAINQKFNQNFCSFVNGFRMKELVRLILENPDFNLFRHFTNCGFGSVNSMKRCVMTITGLSLSDFKSSVLNKGQRA